MREPDLSDINRSWHTRMASVTRQFRALSQSTVFDRKRDQMVDIIGMFIVPTPDDTFDVRLNVAPSDNLGKVYTCELADLET